MSEAAGRGSLPAMHTGAWYGDLPFQLEAPARWDVEVMWPRTPSPLTPDEIVASLQTPMGQPPLRRLAEGSRRPVIVVDDPTRPTPAFSVMPLVLRELEEAGIPPSAVQVVVATGTHGAPTQDAVRAKVGAEAMARCGSIHVHDHLRGNVRRGTTRFGTPVYIDRVVAQSDFVLGIGGVYPQHTTWFGGGAKILLGVLGERSIASLHYRHWRLTGPYAIENEFRADLNDVARIARMRSSISIHVDAARQPVRVTVGDPESYYAAAARFTKDVFHAPVPGDADIVISNAYPMDTSLTFAQSKGTTPLKHARPGATRILLGACSEGLGHHGLFPLFNVPRRYYTIQRLRRAWIRRSEIPGKVASQLRALPTRCGGHTTQAGVSKGILLYRPADSGVQLPEQPPGLREVQRWADLLDIVAEDHPGTTTLRTVVYPCAPLQVLDL